VWSKSFSDEENIGFITAIGVAAEISYNLRLIGCTIKELLARQIIIRARFAIERGFIYIVDVRERVFFYK
jgi:hypothetical protein